MLVDEKTSVRWPGMSERTWLASTCPARAGHADTLRPSRQLPTATVDRDAASGDQARARQAAPAVRASFQQASAQSWRARDRPQRVRRATAPELSRIAARGDGGPGGGARSRPALRSAMRLELASVSGASSPHVGRAAELQLEVMRNVINMYI